MEEVRMDVKRSERSWSRTGIKEERRYLSKIRM
jgi:hypothetical protein